MIEVKQKVPECFKIVTSSLLCVSCIRVILISAFTSLTSAALGIVRAVVRTSYTITTFTVWDVLLRYWISIELREAKVDHEERL